MIQAYVYALFLIELLPYLDNFVIWSGEKIVNCLTLLKVQALVNAKAKKVVKAIKHVDHDIETERARSNELSEQNDLLTQLETGNRQKGTFKKKSNK